MKEKKKENVSMELTKVHSRTPRGDALAISKWHTDPKHALPAFARSFTSVLHARVEERRWNIPISFSLFFHGDRRGCVYKGMWDAFCHVTSFSRVCSRPRKTVKNSQNGPSSSSSSSTLLFFLSRSHTPTTHLRQEEEKDMRRSFRYTC